MQEQWTHWEPLPDLAGNYNFISCCDNYENGLRVILHILNDPKKQLHVTWKYSVESYKKTQGSLAIKMKESLGDHYGKAFDGNKTFFKIINSKYFQELSEQSGGLIDYNPCHMHFVIFALEDILIDVISNYEPEVTVVDID